MDLKRVDTPMRAIRAKCLDCCCGSSKEVRLCPCPDCPLYPYRFGHRPQKNDVEEVPDEGDGFPETE